MHSFAFHLCALLAVLGSVTAAATSSNVDLSEFAASTAPPALAAEEVPAYPAVLPLSAVSYDTKIDFVPVGGVVDSTGSIGAVDADGLDFSVNPPAPSVEVIPCNVKESSKNDCIKGLFAQIVPLLKAGLPEYGMSSIDPYFYKRGIFRYANDGVQGGLLIKNMFIHGISKLKVNNVQSNFSENAFIIKLNVELPKLQADGQFKADVKLGGLRLVPKGPFNITIDNVRATILTDGTISDTPRGTRRLQLRRLNANVVVGEARIIANGIFTDRNLNAMILNLVNENLPEITRVGIPATREQWAPILVGHINDFFFNVPIDKFLVQ